MLQKHLTLRQEGSSTHEVLLPQIAKLLTFVFQSESSCRHTNIGEEVEVQLVGGAVEERRDGGASGRRLIVGV